MAVEVKVLLLDETNQLGTGLRAIREHENDLIDFSAFESGVSDSTCVSGTYGRIIKNNKVYSIVKNYYDLDKNRRIFVAELEKLPYNIL